MYIKIVKSRNGVIVEMRKIFTPEQKNTEFKMNTDCEEKTTNWTTKADVSNLTDRLVILVS